MAYLGNAPARSFISFERQVFTIVNSQTAYTLDHSVTNENDLRLVINNIVQEPGSGKAYTASGTTLTLSAALTNGTDEMYCVFLGRAVGTVNPPAASVDTAQLAADAVTNALKHADRIVSTRYMTAGNGDGGPCHPRDNIALSWFAEQIDLGYDIFGDIMRIREIQAENIAKELCSHNRDIEILCKSFIL